VNLKLSILLCNGQWVDTSYGGSKVAKNPDPKVHINGKINIKMERNVKNQC
jgi:hypothetical protein